MSPEFDLPTMMAQKQVSVDALGHGIEFLFRKNRVDRIDGWARLAGPGNVQVRKPDGSDIQLTTRHVVLATGSIPTPLTGVTVDQVRIVDSTGALTLCEVPKKLLVIGGGSIGLELGSVWCRLGAEVEVVEFLDHIIPGADEAISPAFQKMLEKQGFTFRLSTKVLKATTTEAGVAVEVESLKDGAKATIEADVVLVAVGRRPFVGELGLETVNLTLDERGFVPTQTFATAAPGVWAIGDVTFGPMLAHKAEDGGKHPNPGRPNATRTRRYPDAHRPSQRFSSTRSGRRPARRDPAQPGAAGPCRLVSETVTQPGRRRYPSSCWRDLIG